MSEQRNPEVKHVFDGIEEHDNALPNWWLAILWSSIVFAFGYWFYYHPSGLGPDQQTLYERELAAVQQQRELLAPTVTEQLLLALAEDGAVVEQGRALYAQQCAACHAAGGQGLIGPNLTDRYWLHGGSPVQIHKSIAEGVVARGMPGWQQTLGGERVQQITAFVLTLRGKELAGKEPQGQPLD
jgi:cytochrome c oxidase cbb3-type subunit III